MPFVLAYLVVSYLQGGIGVGSSGLLSNLRQYLWVPIFQTAYRCTHPCTFVYKDVRS